MRTLFACVSALLAAAWLAACPHTPRATVPHKFAPSFSYGPPPDWAHDDDPVHPNRVWTRIDGDAHHVFNVFPVPGDDANAFAAAQMQAVRAHGIVVTDEGTVRVCDGERARRWRFVSHAKAGPTEVHYLVTPITGGLGVTRYEHPRSVPPRRDGLDAMTRVCPGQYSVPIFDGWKAPTTLMGLDGIETSPDGRSTFAVTITGRRGRTWDEFLRAAPPPGRIVSDRYEPCGPSRVRLIETRRGSDVIETSSAVIHQFGYRFTYTRPAGQPPLAAPQRALTLFCRPPQVR